MSDPKTDLCTNTVSGEYSRLVTVDAEPSGLSAAHPSGSLERGRRLCEELERGNFLFFPRTPFDFSPEDREFLLAQRQANAGYHKNIAFRPSEQRLTGLGKSAARDADRFRSILRQHSDTATRWLAGLLPAYASHLRRDLASYRPLEERGRTARLHARNDLLHVDAFPTRPTNGDRILRVFTNLNPSQNRVWLTSETFDIIAPRLARTIGLPAPRSGVTAAPLIQKMLRAIHWPGVRRSPYDDFMHRCHNFLKEDTAFQAGCSKHRWEFPPNSTWIVFTDMVSHAVVEGQFAIEQTFLVPRGAMVLPEKSPISILEKLCGSPLSNPA